MNSNCPGDDNAVAENSERTIKGMGEMERVSDRLFKVCVSLCVRALMRVFDRLVTVCVLVLGRK